MEVTFDFEINTLIGNGRLHAQEVNSIKNWLPDETLPQLTDEQIAVFLIACDREVAKTKTTIKNYYNITQLMPEVFTNRCVKNDSLRRMLDISYYCLLPTRTSDNCAVIILKARDPDYRKFDFETHLKLICMLLDSIVYVNPPDGLIGLLDMEGASLMHLTVLKLRLVVLFTRYVQEGLRLKMKSIHLFNGGYALNALYNMFKPFLQRDIKELIHFQQSDSASIKKFYENFVGKDCLPEEYGGNLPSLQFHHENTVRQLNLMQPYFDAEERQSDRSHKRKCREKRRRRYRCKVVRARRFASLRGRTDYFVLVVMRQQRKGDDEEDEIIRKDYPRRARDVCELEYQKDRFAEVVECSTSLKHLSCMRVGLLKVFLQYVLQAQPLQMKKIHFINAFPLLHNFLALIKIFYKTIAAEKVVVHNIGNDISQFYDNYISQKFFPIDYGGDMPCCQTLHRNQIEKFKQMADYFASEQEQRRRKTSCLYLS
ncbi:hypothetical protein FQA39_LY14851 [Lamprigera yunnana]|nr:hypothetical protein FQA39_LY14851 [Lamprigera yunnana]